MRILSFSLFEKLEFKKREKKADAKTDTFDVIKDDTEIGQVKWWSRVRGYGFVPPKEDEPVVKDFVADLMAKRRAEKKKAKKQFESKLAKSAIDPDKKWAVICKWQEPDNYGNIVWEWDVVQHGPLTRAEAEDVKKQALSEWDKNCPADRRHFRHIEKIITIEELEELKNSENIE